ncbi:MAG: response regulator transcription factor [Ruminococcaceae bacterium]|nr:response regulator transcription factor [Oscillospiraceae bacterium]
MLKIAFCDDDREQLFLMQTYAEQYSITHSTELSCTLYDSPFELLAAMEQGERFDVLFLDVLMPGENGMDAAAEIRSLDETVKIIFLTSSADFAVQSYTVGAFYYQLKPMEEAEFSKRMDAVVAVLDKERESSLILRCKNGITRVEARRLSYCEVIHRTLLIHLTSGQVLECIGSLDELCGRLADYNGFFRPHRSYLVNLEHVQSISYHGIVMLDGAEIPIPRGKYSEIKNAFMEYAFR